MYASRREVRGCSWISVARWARVGFLLSCALSNRDELRSLRLSRRCA
jgi:hypothetical protein